MYDNINVLKSEIINKINEAQNIKDLDNIKNNYLSKKGEFSKLMIHMRELPNEEKPTYGKLVNEAKEEIENLINNKLTNLKEIELLNKIELEKIDVTIPGDTLELGTIHPLNQVIEDLEDFFIAQGYEVKDGPEVEKDYYNFEMMNFPKGHPVREMQDTFYVDKETLLRTHTSPVQARVMLENSGSPVKIICPGKTYRRDEDDLTHSHQFMQIEGLVIDENITFANLKDTLLQMVRHIFGEKREIRLRPSYFPFVEPGVEVDVVHTLEDGTKTYIEILGAGMVHPNVLKMGGYDPKKYSGFAFG
ncbi:MAG TPA: phenylalanine--tRNA ligase subunit alpha, partial [Acholeplasma sp.]|nr:phenylalanine--tRNA ligase subunit alpha [Acholeplasma sp.]